MPPLPSAAILEAYLAKTPASAALAERAKRVLPGGVVTDTRIFEPYGIYIERGSGARKWDVDGNAYLDLFGGHGANMLGHGDEVVSQVIAKTVREGTQYAANQPYEVQLAEEITRLVRSADRVRFTGSGTEATLLALRLARAFTGRRLIVRFSTHYHGWHDHAASGYADHFDGSAAPGVLNEVAEATILVPPGDVDALLAAAQDYGAEIAAFIIEPVGTHFGVVPLDPQFLGEVQRAAKACGALFILDEVLSGFRVDLGGAQGLYGLSPDLTTFAKALFGGLPGGAVVGRSDVLGLLDPDPARRGGKAKVLHQGTFSGNPASTAAGLAMLNRIKALDGCRQANALGAKARGALNSLFEELEVPLTAYGQFSIFHLFIHSDPQSRTPGFNPAHYRPSDYLRRPQPLTNRLRMALNVLGVDVNTKLSGLFSAVHTDDDVSELVSAMRTALLWVRREGLI